MLLKYVSLNMYVYKYVCILDNLFKLKIFLDLN